MPRILIVEDEFTIALALKSVVQEAGYEVVGPVGRVEQALARISNSPPDLAILDASLGGQSSEPIAQTLSEMAIPFLVISGYSRQQLGDWVADVTLIGKPFLDAEVIKEISRQLNMRA